MFDKARKNWMAVTVMAGVLFMDLSPCLAAASNPLVQGQPIQATPYDRRIGEAGGFTDFEPVMSAQSSEALFSKARSFRYKADERGQDRWQTPSETEARWSGDCEDKALWLYTNLKKNGHRGVRLVVGRQNRDARGFHVWVTLEASAGSFFILDPTAQKRIWNVSDFSDGSYRPLYSFDGINRYRHNP